MTKIALFMMFIFITGNATPVDKIDLKKYFTKQKCDQILSNGGYFTTCYDFEMKGAKYVSYSIEASRASQTHEKFRPKYYKNRKISNTYRSAAKDYKYNGLKVFKSRIADTSSFDYSQTALISTYVMSNTIPYISATLDKIRALRAIEKFGKILSVRYGKMNVLNGIVYNKEPIRIGINKIAVPTALWKIYYNDTYQKCFYFEDLQTTKKKKIRDYEIRCSTLLKM
ncbi:DNA/RNA non-specific endonuclease [Sulfurimonas sp. SAG-AH-194-I05]|nr:DNA/RNA non-specific endonuclease [Sulfurimonas sp. SAG-AH-194-I05]MDF1875731.1 DNA/RNA non-specific endonuclease [Sulfurimonas sp. SAG-AH-194-I05]